MTGPMSVIRYALAQPLRVLWLACALLFLPPLAHSRVDGMERELASLASERRGLRPVGKNHFVARTRLQPGDTTLRIMEHRWDMQLPRNIDAGDYLITLYAPPGIEPELHLFAVDDLLAEHDPHIPAWLPDEVNLTPRSG